MNSGMSPHDIIAAIGQGHRSKILSDSNSVSSTKPSSTKPARVFTDSMLVDPTPITATQSDTGANNVAGLLGATGSAAAAATGNSAAGVDTKVPTWVWIAAGAAVLYYFTMPGGVQ